jgi:two-component system response regulator FixJ
MIGTRRLVLVADHDAAVRAALVFSLEGAGFHAHGCADGVQLLAHPWLALSICLVVDHRMPVMDGFAVLARLAARGCHVPVILMTSHSTAELRRRAATAGIQYVLEKPFFDNTMMIAVWASINTQYNP